MLMTIDNSNRDTEGWRLEEAYRLRHRVFVEEMGWEALRQPDGRETDQFDDEHAVHMLLYEGAELIGYQRMLPTTRPYLLTEIYPQLCDGEPPRDPSIYEWTRFAVVPEHRGDGRGLGRAGAELVLGYVEWGLASGIDTVVVELEPIQTLKFIQCGFLTACLGVMHHIGGRGTVAMLAHFDERTRRTLLALLGKPVSAHHAEAIEGGGDAPRHA